MRIEVVMPKMGESLQEGTITKWLKQEGESVERDEMILEISTDKVDTEVPSPNAGVLSKILFPENETVAVGTVIAYIETEAGAQTSEAPAAEVEAPNPTEEEIPADTPVAQAQEKTTPDPTPQNAPQNSPSGAMVDVVMPKMGESLQEGTVTKWLKKQGEQVERDEMILEISTDKVDTEVPSPVDGVLSEILVAENETVAVGTVIAKISVGGSAPGTVPAPDTTAPGAELPGTAAETFQAQKQVQSVYGTPGEGIQPAKPLEPVAQQSAGQSTKQGLTSAPIEGTKEIPRRHEDKFFSPLVRKIAEENGIYLEELTSIKGSGIEGRVTKDDLENYVNNRPQRAAQQAPAAGREQALPQPKTMPPAQEAQRPAASQPRPQEAPKPATTTVSSQDVEVIPMDRVRKLIADHMVYSKQTSPHVTSVAEADVTAIVKFREKHKDEFLKKEGFKLTYTPFFAQAATDAIRAYPMVNVSVEGTNILRHRRINLAFATALDDGNLIVPVIKNAESLNLTGFARSVNDLATRARSKKLNPDDIQGGTFTITNVGTFGTLFGMPIINQPQTGIMGIGAIQKRPVVKEIDGDDLIVVRSMVYVSLTYDHRVIDGMLAGKWLAELVKRLESMNETNILL